MKITRHDLLIIFLAVISLVGAWQLDVILPQRVVVAPLYLILILIVASHFRTRIVILWTILAISILTSEQIYEAQHYLTIIFDNIGIAIVSYLAIRLNTQRVTAGQLKEVSENTKKQLEVLMHVVSHDIKQPITVAKLIAMSLSKTTKGNNYTLVKKLNDALEGITMLTSDLGDAARIAGRQFILKHEHIDLSQLLQEVVSEEQLITAKHKIIVATPEKIIGDWDKERLKRVFINLLSNAIKYSSGGIIKVRAKKKN